MRNVKFTEILTAFVFAATLFWGSSSYANGLAQQTSEDGGVTIAVTPVDVSAKAATWKFEVSLDARGLELSDDLLRTAYVLDRAGNKKIAPSAWAGDGPAANHRKGLLSFKAVTPMPKAVELRIQRADETAPRVFRWDLDCPCNDPKMHAAGA